MSGLREMLLGIERVEIDDLRTWWAGIARDRAAPAQAARWARDRALLEVARRARGRAGTERGPTSGSRPDENHAVVEAV